MISQNLQQVVYDTEPQCTNQKIDMIGNDKKEKVSDANNRKE